MLEIPESYNISVQVQDMLINKTITKVSNATSLHKFTWFSGDPNEYGKLLTGKTIQSAKGHGMFVDLYLDDDVTITIGDGTHIRYFMPYENQPFKYQLLITFDDNSFLVFTVAMYGSIYAYKGGLDNPYYQKSRHSPSPLENDFNETVYDNIFKSIQKDISVKALLATEQRIPGLGNGVLQDILFKSGIHPKRKISGLSDFEKGELYHNLKYTLHLMTDQGGRDTEKDLLGNFGRYKTILSKNTYKSPCPNCGSSIIKEAYLGGSIYYCPSCQEYKR